VMKSRHRRWCDLYLMLNAFSAKEAFSATKARLRTVRSANTATNAPIWCPINETYRIKQWGA
jgi:hypothetical protein